MSSYNCLNPALRNFAELHPPSYFYLCNLNCFSESAQHHYIQNINMTFSGSFKVQSEENLHCTKAEPSRQCLSTENDRIVLIIIDRNQDALRNSYGVRHHGSQPEARYIMCIHGFLSSPLIAALFYNYRWPYLFPNSSLHCSGSSPPTRSSTAINEDFHATTHWIEPSAPR